MNQSQINVATVIGARPQIIKASVVSRSLRSIPGLREVLIHTGQHYDENMSGVFFDELRMPQPDYNLQVRSGPHGCQTGRMLAEIETVLASVQPDWLLVYGDTNSTLAGALAAAKLGIPVAHVEAGLRSFNRAMPEEINRVVTDHLSDLLFAPTDAALANLAKEGIRGPNVFRTGDVMFDAALQHASEAESRSDILGRLGVRSEEYALITIHRPENTDDRQRLSAIIEAIATFANELPVVFPVHPRTRGRLRDNCALESVPHDFHILEPIGYLDMIMLEKNARLIATDSGGIQKEAAFYSVPCVTLRAQTEWTELVELGYNRVVPPLSREVILSALRSSSRLTLPPPNGLYGDGHSAECIAQMLSTRAPEDH